MTPQATVAINDPRGGFRLNIVAASIMLALIAPTSLPAQTVTGQATGIGVADVPALSGPASLSYAGSLSQIGIGIDRDLRISAQGSHVLVEDMVSALIAQGWLGRNAGGLRLDYNWIAERDGKVDTSAMVRKLFAAVDRNRDGDSKLTLGAGLEVERWFGSVSLSHGLSGKRMQGDPLLSDSTTTVSGSDNGRPFIDTITTTTATRYYRQAYDYGVGIRAGTWLPDAQMRLSLGFDREWGDFSSRQNTASLGIEKYFTGSPHSAGLFLEHYGKSGQFETDGRGTRAMLTYRFSFGGSAYASPAGWREMRSGRRAQTPASSETSEARQSAAPIVEMRQETRIVKTTASMASDAFFAFDKAELTSVARGELDRVAQILKTTERAGNIHIVGHTCDIGSDAYNLKLSLRRANAVKDYLARAGLPADAFVVEGLGKRDPKYPNKPDTRAKNRRVDLEFVQYHDKKETVQVPVEIATPVTTAKPPVTWHEEVVDHEPAWVRRALRNTVSHKTTVDTYRGADVSKSSSTSRAWVNRAPLAQDDSFTVPQDVTTTLSVLSNDSDPDGNALTIVAVGAAAHGAVTIAGNVLRYTPAAGYTGNDSFSYTIDDGAGGRATAIVRVTVQRVNHAPMANDDRFVVGYTGNWPLDVLANDTDPDGDALSIISFTQPQPASSGTVSQDGSRLIFHSSAQFSVATFTYTISDGHGGTSTATVTLVDP
jgi:outer membrane protein OmpA-like peptidoglycan-associated protein